MAGAIKGITIEIGGNTTKLDKALKEVNSRTKELQSELKGVNSLLKMDPSNVTLLKQKQDLLTKSIANTKDKLNALKQAQEQVQAQFDKGEITEEQYRDFQREIVATENKLKSLTKELKNFGSVGAQQVANVGKKVEEVGGKIENAGKKIAGISAVATGALIGTAKVAIDFESAWTGVTKTVNGSEAELEAIRQGILDLSQSTSSSAEEIAAVAENAGQLGVQTENILAFTETMVRLGDSTNLSADEASSAIAKLFNIMGSDINNVDAFGATIVELGNNFATTEADILNMATRVAASGKQIGLSEQEILALSASLSSVGLEAEAGGSAISQIMTQVDKDVALNTEKLSTWADVAGMSVGEFKSLWEKDAMSAIQKLVGGMGDASRGGENLNVILDELGITSIRQSDTMKRLSGASDMLTKSVKLSNSAWDENSALTEESDKRYQTTEAKIQQLKGTLTELCVTLGETLLPIISKLVDGLAKVVKWFTNLSPVAQKIILAITGIVAVAGPLLIFIGNIVQAVGAIMTIAPKLVPLINGIKTAVSGLFSMIAAHPIIAIITAIVAVVIYLYNNCEWFRDGIHNILNSIGQFFANCWNGICKFFTETIPNAWNSFLTFCGNFINKIVSFFQELPGKIWTWLLDVVNKIKTWGVNLYNSAVNAVKNAINSVVKFFTELPNKIAYALGYAIGKVILFGQKLWNFATVEIPKFIGKVVDWFKQLPGKIWTWLVNVVTKIGQWGVNMKNKAVSAVTTLINNVVTFFKQLPGKIASAISSAITKVANWGTQIKNKAVSAIKNLVSNVVSTAKSLPGKIWSAITGCFQKIVSWGSQMKAKASTAIKNVVSSITNTFKSLPSKMANIGKNIIEGLWNGLKNAKNWIVDKIKSLGGSLVSGIKAALGIKSPSTVFRDQVGRYIAEGIGVGVTENADSPIEAVNNLTDEMLNGTESINGATIERKLSTTFNGGAVRVPTTDNRTLLSKLDSIYDRLAHLQVVLDSGTLVGEILDPIDVGLADKQALNARGV